MVFGQMMEVPSHPGGMYAPFVHYIALGNAGNPAQCEHGGHMNECINLGSPDL